MVTSSGMQPGDALESEMALCQRFEVSRPLVRRVLVELSEEGLIRSVPGKGHYLADPQGVAMPQSGAIVCVSGSTRPAGMGPDVHVMAVMEGLGQALGHSPYRLLWEHVGAKHRKISEMVKPHLSELRAMALMPLADQSVPQMLEAVPERVKHVVVGRPTGDVSSPCVYVDHYEGMLRAVRYLMGLGHRRIGYVNRAEASWTMTSRFAAYQAALGEADCRPFGVVDVEEEPEHVEQVVLSMLERNRDMTALVVAAGSLLPWVLRALQIKKVEVPDELSLVSFDDVQVSRQHLPAITVARQPTRQMGLLAGRMLLQLLNGQTPSAVDVALKCELVVRDSARPVVE